MGDLEAELDAARALDVEALADAIESIGFSCTRCGACCRGDGDEHTATVFPDEVRALADDGDEWRDVARPLPFGLDADYERGATFEWALQTDACGDCTFYASADDAGERPGRCTVYDARPLICRTYPFSVDLGGTEPTGAVDRLDAPLSPRGTAVAVAGLPVVLGGLLAVDYAAEAAAIPDLLVMGVAGGCIVLLFALPRMAARLVHVG